MIDSTNAIGASVSTNTVRATVGAAVNVTEKVEHSKSLRLMSETSVTVTDGAVTKGLIKLENDSPDERRKSRILSGEPPVSKLEFVDSAGVRNEEHV